MIRIKRLYVLLVVVCVCSENSFSQSVNWAIKPVHAALERLDENLFKIRKDNKTGLLNSSGEVIVPVQYDSITSFTNGIALVLLVQKDQLQIKGFLSQTHSAFSPVKEEFYLVENHHVVSEGLLCVKTPEGKMGFMGVDGKIAIPCKFKEVHPFCDGVASVDDGQGTKWYINPTGAWMNQEFGGEMQYCFSFYNGLGIVVDDGGTAFFVDNTGKIGSKFKMPPTIVADAYFRINAEPDKDAPIQQKKNTNGVSVFEEGGRWGFKSAHAIILPPQFKYAESFSNDLAIVNHQGKFGVLKLQTDSFSGNAKETTLSVFKGKPAKFEYSVTTPQGWTNRRLTLKLEQDDGEFVAQQEQTSENGSATFYFNLKTTDSSSENKTYRLTVSGDSLLLWKGTQEIAVQFLPMIKIGNLMARNERADANDNFRAYFTVTNMSSESEEVTISLTETGGLQSKSYKLSLEANASKNIDVLFSNVKKQETRSLNVTSSSGESARLSIKVIPFY